jgi:hypothetical protein
MSLAALLACAALALAQSPPPGKEKAKEPAKKSALEQALEEALANNPDLRMAEAQAALARAALAKARLEVIQKVVVAEQALRAARADLVMVERELARLSAIHAKKGIEAALVDAAQAKVLKARAALESAEAALKFLQGKGGPEAKAADMETYYRRLGHDLAADLWAKAAGRYGTVRALDPRDFERILPPLTKADVAPTMAERIRKALDKKVTLKFDSVPLPDVLAQLGKLAGLHIKLAEAGPVITTGEVGEVTLGAALQLIEDSVPKHRFVVREYGLLFVSEDKMPPGAVTLMAFWKGAPKEKAADPAKYGLIKLSVQGKVKAVDKGLIKLDVGSDAGVVKGDVLDVYRLSKEPVSKYLGKVTVIDVSPTECVARPVGMMLAPPRPGDNASRLLPSPAK